MTIAAVAAVVSLPVRAAGPSRWEISSSDQWMAGRGEQVAVTRDGRLTLGPAVRVIHEDASPALWTAATAPDGTLYVGTGNDGQVIAVSGDKARVFWDSEELQVHALAWQGDALLAGTSPDGKVYRITPDGKATVVFDPEETYVWALAVDRQQRVYVATGGKGRVYRVPKDGGTATKIFESAAANVTALSVNDAGDLLVGTDSPGRLYRVPAGGKPFALLDGPYSQVQAIRPGSNGVTWILAVSPGATPAAAPAPPVPASATPTAQVSTEVTVVAIGDSTSVTAAPPASASSSSTASSSSGAKGAVYRLGADGLVDTYWEATGELPFDLLPTSSGRLLVSADNGVVYALDGEPVRTARIAQVPGRQLTRIVPRGDRFLVTASNPGKILELAGASAPTGSYTSEVKDATTGASWGLLRWEGTKPAGSSVAFSTRSGNTSTPDDTWADWVPVREDDGVQRIASPPARYLQWKVDLAGAPVLDHVTLTYLPRNQRPRLTSLTIHPPGVVFQLPYATQEPPDLAGYLSTTPAPARDQAISAATPTATAAPVGRRLYQKGFQTFQWEATDPDKDDLRYEVAVRRVGADDWRVLARELVGTVYTWDTSLLPDGRYVVRVIAADNRANPDATALQGEREGGPLTIDNTPPTLHVSDGTTAATASNLGFEVTDAASTLDRVDVLLGNGQWRPVFPIDGALDGLRERFSIPLATLGDGPVVLRATDSLGNLATLDVRPPKPFPSK
jgi:sugar lactone lactonase YvrE